MPPNFYGLIKREYDKTLRGLQQGTKGGMSYEIDPVTLEPSVSKPSSDLNYHKTSSDHDGRYYTEDEVDQLLAALPALHEQSFTDSDSWVVTHNLGKHPLVTIWEETIPSSAFGSQPFGTSYFGGHERVIFIAYPTISQIGLNSFTVSWLTNKTGKVVYMG